MGGHPKSMHLVLERTEGCISSQAMETRDIVEKATPEELCVTLSGRKGCFACNERSHNLDQCKTKYKLVSRAHQFGYATKFPFTVIEPSDEMVERKKFYHHCVIIKSNVTNLDKGVLKDELNIFWKLSGDWELRRECNMAFLASFSSEGDVISCLNNPNIEILADNKEVKLTLTRWKEDDGGRIDLIEEWILVSGVPRIYRNWKDLYKIASAFGVLIDVDEKSLEVEDKEPIKLKTMFRSFDGAPFSHCFAFGWSSKLVTVTAVQDKTEDMKHKNKELDKDHRKELNAANSLLLEEPKCIEESGSRRKGKENKISDPAATVTNFEITAIESSNPEAVQSIAPSPRSMVWEEHSRGVQKRPFERVYQRRGKKQQVIEAINKSPSNKMDKELAPHSSSSATRTGASAGCDMLDQKDSSKVEPKGKLNMEEITPVGESKKAEKLGACSTEHTNVAAPTINAKKTQIFGDTSRTPRDELITEQTKGVGKEDQMGSGFQVHKKEDAFNIDTRQLPSSEGVGCIYGSFSEMGLQENLLKGIYQYGLEKPSAVHQRGIVPLCKGFGVVHRSLSGTTETICSGVLQRLDYGSTECQALILVPTPELAQETKKVLGALGQFLGVTAQTCTTGGTSAHADQQTLPRRVQVLVGTPDCILDMLQRHALSPDQIRMLFLDEADELLTGGSKDQICDIVLHLPKKIQDGLFSATYSNEAMQTSLRFMDKQRVAVIVPREEELKNVKQYYLEVDNEGMKLGRLYALFKTIGMERLVIFVNTKDKAVSLAQAVGKHYTVSVSHDGMGRHTRNKAIQKFESGSSSALIATDHHPGTNAMPQVPIIINYDLPTESMRYVRRLQQQNREFRQPQSVVINLVTPADRRTLAAITRFCNSSMGELPSDLKK